MIATHPCILLLTLACSSAVTAAAAVMKKSEKRQTSTCSSYSKCNSLFFHHNIIPLPRRHFLFLIEFKKKPAIINTRGTGEPPGPCPEFITMNQNILSKLPGGKVYNTNYRAALDQISEYGTDDVRPLILFPFFPRTTTTNTIQFYYRSSPTSAQPSNPAPTNVLFCKAIRKVPLRPFPRSPVSHYHHPHHHLQKMEMQSKRCF